MSRIASRNQNAAPQALAGWRGKPERSVYLLLTMLASIHLGCSGEQGAEHEVAPETGTAGRNIILISIDSLRADHLQCYGYDRPTSPASCVALKASGFWNVMIAATASSIFTMPLGTVHSVPLK